jgi:Lectin C-type domain
VLNDKNEKLLRAEGTHFYFIPTKSVSELECGRFFYWIDFLHSRWNGTKLAIGVWNFKFGSASFRTVADQRRFWVSATDIGRTPHGQFQWVDETPVDKSTWDSGEPNHAGAGRETCVYLDIRSAKLYDYSCSDNKNIMCEVAASFIAS